jgi:DNA-binding transcriptional LysR family regulator
MELQALRTFKVVAEEGGVLSASRKLNTVQSNVTSRIKRLEAEVGQPLFYRKGRGLELSPSGKLLLEYARKILRLESQANLALQQVGEQSGELRIGAMETYAALHLPNALREVRKVHPHIKLHVETATSSTLVQLVLEHKLDCAVVGGEVEHADLIASEISTEELVLVHAKKKRCDDLPLILFREGCAYRARALQWQREQGTQAREVMEFSTLEGILGCVSVGLGCTLMPRWVVSGSRYSSELSIHKIDTRLARIPTVLIRHRDAMPLKSIETLRSVMS